MTWISANGGPPPFVSPDRNFSADEIATQEREFRFGDLIDMVNPLHHLPVIGTIYRSLTGDTLEGPARIVGGMIYGGPIGMASAIGNAILEEHTGRDLNDTLVAAVFGEEEAGPGGDGFAGQPDPAPVAAQAQAQAHPQAQAQAQAQPEAQGQAQPQPPSQPPSQAAPTAAAGGEEPLSGLAALRAFARDSGLVSGERPAQPSSAPSMAGAMAGSMAAPTTAASTSGQASTRQAPVDEQAAESALQAAASGPRPDRGGEREALRPLAAAAGGPPPAERFMPLGARAFAGPMTVSASRGAIAAAAEGPSAGAFGPRPAALGSEGDYRPPPGAAASPQHPVADQMMEALLKYQALRQSRGEI